MTSHSSFPILCSLKNLVIHIEPFLLLFPLNNTPRQLTVESESSEMRGKSTEKANYCHYTDSCCAMVNYGDNSCGTMPKAESSIWLQKCGFFT